MQKYDEERKIQKDKIIDVVSMISEESLSQLKPGEVIERFDQYRRALVNLKDGS